MSDQEGRSPSSRRGAAGGRALRCQLLVVKVQSKVRGWPALVRR